MLEVYDELFEQFFLFHKDIFMGFFLSWEDEYRDSVSYTHLTLPTNSLV